MNMLYNNNSNRLVMLLLPIILLVLIPIVLAFNIHMLEYHVYLVVYIFMWTMTLCTILHLISESDTETKDEMRETISVLAVGLLTLFLVLCTASIMTYLSDLLIVDDLHERIEHLTETNEELTKTIECYE